MEKIRLAILGILLSLGVTWGLAPASQAQGPDGEIYIVQTGDWLSKIAEKYYGEADAYPEIIETTNARAVEDKTFIPITDPNQIEVGQKLWVLPRLEADAITFNEITFKPVTVEKLGIRTYVPRTWPAAELDDPLLRHTWRAGTLSFVSFTTTPGNDALTGVARLLGANKEDLTSGRLGGRLTEVEAGPRTWVLYLRDDAGRSAVAAATVESKVIYQLSLFAETSQTETLLRPILENFEITDPAAAQQSLTIDRPASGLALTNPFELRGSTSQYPFRGRLVYRVLDAEGNQVGRGPFEVVGQLGSPATFALPASYSAVPANGPGTVEVVEISAADGTIIAIDSVGVTLRADPPGYTITIDDPRPYASITSPVQVRGKTSNRPFDSDLNYRVVDAAGQEISRGIFQTVGEAGQVNAFDGFVEFTVSQNGPGRVEVFDIDPATGTVFAIGSVNVWLTTTP